MKMCDKKKKNQQKLLIVAAVTPSAPQSFYPSVSIPSYPSFFPCLHTPFVLAILLLCRSQLGLLLPGGVHLSGLLRDPPQHPRRQQGQVLEPLPLGGPRGAGETTGASSKPQFTLFLWIVFSNSRREREWMMNVFFKEVSTFDEEHWCKCTYVTVLVNRSESLT